MKIIEKLKNKAITPDHGTIYGNPILISGFYKFIKIYVLIFAAVFFFSACKHAASELPLPANKISGKWRIDSLVSIFRDSTGHVRGTQLYPQQPGVDWYFQFNNDGTWNEPVISTNTTPPGYEIASYGNYVLRSDTTFDMISDNSPTIHCNIIRLTPASFVFKLSSPTVFDGITPGIIERIFTLKK